ncbi:MAG TPA: DUF4384 domain-containing protein [Bryobacteraceae bacterium]|jgi:hypothetical protein|nr:DUF4384 domain-containing protein [Bryobacteraceae bacterium]
MPLCVAASLAAAFTAAAQDAPKQFTARELFYSAGDETASKPATRPVAKPSQPSATAATAPSKRAPATQVANTGAKPPAMPEPVAKPSATVTATRVQTAMATAPDGSPIIRATDSRPATAPAPANGPALGLKITLLKRSGGDDLEIAPDTVFHAGDKIRFSVQTNGPGYLYIVNQGSSGTWKPVFPSPEIADGDNHVDGWHAYVMPPKRTLVFDEQTGTEKIFIVFSRDPEPEFEKMIYSLPGAKGEATMATPATPAKSVPPPQAAPRQSKEMLVMAKLNVPDSAVDKFRQTYSRDLIIERVDETTPTGPGEKKEKAVYVVNPTGSSDPRVVADLALVHQ